MDIEEFREYCLSLGDVTEKMPFGKFAKRYDSILAFYVTEHMFCLIDIENFSFVNIRSTPEEIENIRASYYSVGNPVNPTMRHWIRLDLYGDIPMKNILKLVKRAYEIIYLAHTPSSHKANNTSFDK